MGGQPGTPFMTPEHLQACSGAPTAASDVFRMRGPRVLRRDRVNLPFRTRATTSTICGVCGLPHTSPRSGVQTCQLVSWPSSRGLHAQPRGAIEMVGLCRMPWRASDGCLHPGHGSKQSGHVDRARDRRGYALGAVLSPFTSPRLAKWFQRDAAEVAATILDAVEESVGSTPRRTPSVCHALGDFRHYDSWPSGPVRATALVRSLNRSLMSKPCSPSRPNWVCRSLPPLCWFHTRTRHRARLLCRSLAKH